MKRVAVCFLLTACVALATAQAVQRDSTAEKPTGAMCDAAAPKLHEAGTNKIVLMMTVDAKGRVKSFKTESPKGLRLEKMKEAAASVRKIQFAPAKKGGSPFPVEVLIEFDCGGRAASGNL